MVNFAFRALYHREKNSEYPTAMKLDSVCDEERNFVFLTRIESSAVQPKRGKRNNK